MADSFESMYRGLLMHVPDLPPFLAQQFIRNRYRLVCERRPWSGLRAESEFLTNTSKSAGTVAVTRNSSTVTGTSTAFASTDLGRQFMVGGRAPLYTIEEVDVTTQTLTLDRVFGGDTNASAQYVVLDAYVTVPSDFQYFDVVYDPAQNWRLRHWVTQQELARLDPARSTTGTPWALVDRSYSSLQGLPSYELWPYTLTARNYPFYYIKRPADLVNDDDTPIYPIRGDILVSGALADCARWPGTPERPNVMFSKAIELSREYEKIFEDKLVDMERQDESTYMTWLADADWSSWPYAPVDAAFLQRHAW
jgi:hypothetical protein